MAENCSHLLCLEQDQVDQGESEDDEPLEGLCPVHINERCGGIPAHQ